MTICSTTNNASAIYAFKWHVHLELVTLSNIYFTVVVDTLPNFEISCNSVDFYWKVPAMDLCNIVFFA